MTAAIPEAPGPYRGRVLSGTYDNGKEFAMRVNTSTSKPKMTFFYWANWAGGLNLPSEISNQLHYFRYRATNVLPSKRL